MSLPMMPKATAVWLVENTTLTFDQIADFCGLHALEVQAIADDEIAVGMVGLDPTVSGQLTDEQIAECEKDPKARLKLLKSDLPEPQKRPKGARYTPVAKRQDKPDGIAWLIRHYPELSDAAVGRLLGTTKPTINAVRNRTHWNSANIRPRDPVEIGLCTSAELVAELEKAGVKFRAEDLEDEAAASDAPAAAAQPVPAGKDGDATPAPAPAAAAEDEQYTPESVFGTAKVPDAGGETGDETGEDAGDAGADAADDTEKPDPAEPADQAAGQDTKA